MGKVGIGEPNQYAIPRGNFCEQYTFGAGWDKTMVLQLGEGAEEYREWIEMAVKVWNDAIKQESFRRAIRISNERPRNYRISRSFWEDDESGDDVTSDQKDGENVIYFKPAAEYTGTLGMASVRSALFGNSITEADVYINTRLDENRGGQVADFIPLSWYGDDHAVYIYIHHAFLTVLHELGHALGLDHIPIAGNIMSYSFWDNLREQWEAPMALHMHRLHVQQLQSGVEAVANDFFVDRHDAHWEGNVQNLVAPLSNDRWRMLTNYYTSRVRLGEQEKMMLACIYEFDN